RQARFPGAVRTDWSSGPVRPAAPGVQPLPAPVHRIPRALHLRTGGGSPDLGYGLHLRTRRRRHRGTGPVRAVGHLDRHHPAVSGRAPGSRDTAVVPFLIWLSRWFQRASAKAYRRTRETVALVIVQFVESMGGMRAVQTFRRESRNQEIFERVNEDYRMANTRAFQLIATFSPLIKVIGNVTIAVVLTYGGYRALHGQVEVG